MKTKNKFPSNIDDNEIMTIDINQVKEKIVAAKMYKADGFLKGIEFKNVKGKVIHQIGDFHHNDESHTERFQPNELIIGFEGAI